MRLALVLTLLLPLALTGCALPPAEDDASADLQRVKAEPECLDAVLTVDKPLLRPGEVVTVYARWANCGKTPIFYYPGCWRDPTFQDLEGRPWAVRQGAAGHPIVCAAVVPGEDQLMRFEAGQVMEKEWTWNGTIAESVGEARDAEPGTYTLTYGFAVASRSVQIDVAPRQA